MGSARWKQGPRYNIHMVEGRTGAGGEGLLASSDQLGPGPVMASSYTQSICWLSWLCLSPPTGWNVHSQSAGDWWWVDYLTACRSSTPGDADRILTAPLRCKQC